MTARTLAARARAAHKRHPDWTATQIAHHIGSTRQAVEAALAVTGAPKGRRPLEPTRTVRLSAKLLYDVGAVAKETGLQLRTLIEGAVAVWLVHRERARDGVTRGVTARGTRARKRQRAADGDS